MATLSVRAAVRQVRTADPAATVEDVIEKVKGLGVTAEPKAVRKSVHGQRSTVAAAARFKPSLAPAAARATAALKDVPAVVTPPKAAPTPKANGASGLTAMLYSVAAVNTLVGVCGGVAQTRQVAEAVGACGGLEPFLQHLALVESIRGGG